MTGIAWGNSPLRILLRSLRAENNGAQITVGITLENGEESESRSFTLTSEQYCALNLKKGELTEEAFEAIETAARLCGAIRCGENLLSYGSNSVKNLSVKLMRHGYTREEATAAAEHLESIGLIDEEADLRREIEKCLRKHWGGGRIRSHLWGKGFKRETLEAVPSLLEEIDFAEHCVALIRKHFGGAPSDREERNRMTASLYRYGYSLSEIKQAFRLLNDG